MAINKNFVIKNGLEVNTKLILADANTNKVGIGSTTPGFELDVAGGIGATDLYVSGVGTFFNVLNVGESGSTFTVLGVAGSVGVGTALPEYLLDIRSPLSTGTTALNVQGDVQISGDLSVDDIKLDVATVGSLYVTGVSTFVGPISYIDVTGISTLGGYVDINDDVDISGSLYVGGATTTNGIDVIGYGEFDDINVVGVATISQLDVQNDFDVYSLESTFHNNLTINGNLTVNGTQNIVNTESLTVNDKTIVLGIGTTPGNEIDDSANGGGIAIASTEGSPLVNFKYVGVNTLPETYKQIIWTASDTFGVGTTDAWLFNYAVGVGSTQVPNGVRIATGKVQLTDNTVNSPNLRITGISTLGNVKISGGIVTAFTGIVTYYGDGSKLSNVINGIGIATQSGLVGTGVTLLDFRGNTVGDVSISSGIATININALVPSASGSDGQIQYNSSGSLAGSSNLRFNGSDFFVSGISTLGGYVDINSNADISGTLNVGGATTIGGYLYIDDDVNVTGVVTAVDFNATSDQTLKTNIQTVDNALDIVSDLRGVSFDWKETGKPSYGVIAQELEQVLPALVSDTDPKTVNYNGIIGVLIEAVKELRDEVERLKNL